MLSYKLKDLMMKRLILEAIVVQMIVDRALLEEQHELGVIDI
mgnify:CR=1 FL=1